MRQRDPIELYVIMSSYERIVLLLSSHHQNLFLVVFSHADFLHACIVCMQEPQRDISTSVYTAMYSK